MEPRPWVNNVGCTLDITINECGVSWHRSSTVLWARCAVLLEDKHVLSKAADHWQQFLHQWQLSVTLSADFILRFSENEVLISKLQYRSRDLTHLVKANVCGEDGWHWCCAVWLHLVHWCTYQIILWLLRRAIVKIQIFASVWTNQDIQQNFQTSCRKRRLLMRGLKSDLRYASRQHYS